MADRRESRDLVDQIGGDVLNSVVEVVAGSIPGVGAAAEALVRKVRQEHQRRRSIALRAAEDASGLTREEIAEAIAKEPRLVPLVTRVLYAAGMNGHDATLKAMGAALGQAVGRPDAIDEAELILTALADLTDNHARTLLLLSKDPPELSGTARVWTVELLERKSDLAPRATSLCLAALVARGLAAVTTGFGGGNVYGITMLGWDVLAVLREYVDTAS